MVHRALAAADRLQEKGISIEVVDPEPWHHWISRPSSTRSGRRASW